VTDPGHAGDRPVPVRVSLVVGAVALAAATSAGVPLAVALAAGASVVVVGVVATVAR
jgi:ABC-type nitrate/sulfonate/bicarbonate transport system substrate-binding protein